MKTILAVFVLILSAIGTPVSAAPNPACEARLPTQRRLEYNSVEILPDDRVSFHLSAPVAAQVKVTSSEIAAVPNGFDGKAFGLPMTKDAQGYWSVTTATTVAPHGIVSTVEYPSSALGSVRRAQMPHDVVLAGTLKTAEIRLKP